MNTEDPVAQILRQLKPVEELPAVGFWPLPWGWWFVILLFVVLVIVISLIIIPKLMARLKQNRQRRNCYRLLDKIQQKFEKHQNPEAALNDTLILLKRIAIQKESRAQVAALSGLDWLQYLDKGLPQPCFERQFTPELTQLRYSEEALTQANAAHFFKLARHWIRHVNF